MDLRSFYPCFAIRALQVAVQVRPLLACHAASRRCQNGALCSRRRGHKFCVSRPDFGKIRRGCDIALGIAKD